MKLAVTPHHIDGGRAPMGRVNSKVRGEKRPSGASARQGEQVQPLAATSTIYRPSPMHPPWTGKAVPPAKDIIAPEKSTMAPLAACTASGNGGPLRAIARCRGW